VRIAIISNTDTFIPFAYALATAGPQLQVHLFFSPSPDGFVNQKVKAFAQQLNISITEEKNAPHELYKWLSDGNFNVCFMLGYGTLINLQKLKPRPAKFYNIHFGTLPSFRGPVPVFWQLKQGMEKIGVTIHEVTEKFDAGPIIWLQETENLPYYNYETVNQLLGQLTVEGVFYILRLIMNNMPLPVINRDHIKPGYHKRPELKDIMIDWQKMNALEICNLIRAGNPWNKGALTSFYGQELKVMDAMDLNSTANLNDKQISPGEIIEDGEKLQVYCADGRTISINMLFYNNSFVPAYQGKFWGLLKGKQLG
jgi:methionyl-tRNA formyltransferase